MSPTRPLRGMTLVELLVATAMGVALLLATSQVVLIATRTQDQLEGQQEMSYQARFAMERIERTIRSKVYTGLTLAKNGDTDQTLAPARFCLNTHGDLIETTATDTSCSGSEVIATGVRAFSLAAAPSSTPLAAASLRVTLQLGDTAGRTLNLTQDVKLKEARE